MKYVAVINIQSDEFQFHIILCKNLNCRQNMFVIEKYEIKTQNLEKPHCKLYTFLWGN